MRNAIVAAALATFALLLPGVPDAGAVTVLTTPGVPANNGQIPDCIITNIDNKPITVTGQLFDFLNGMPQSPSSNNCPVPPATLAPGTGCQVVAQANAKAYCVVTTSSTKVRAALDLFDATTATLVVQAPATK
jgi:hypothetical protein